MPVKQLEINVNQSNNQSTHEKKMQSALVLSVSPMKFPIELLGLVQVCVYGMQNKGVALRAASSHRVRHCWKLCQRRLLLTEDAPKLQ